MSAGRTLRVFTYDGNPNGKMYAPSRGYLCVDYATPPAVYQAQKQGKTHWTKVAPGGTVTTVSSPNGSISVSTGTTTPKLEVAKAPASALVEGTDVTIVTTDGKAKISASGSGGAITVLRSTLSESKQVTPRTTTPVGPTHLTLTAAGVWQVVGHGTLHGTSDSNTTIVVGWIGHTSSRTGAFGGSGVKVLNTGVTYQAIEVSSYVTVTAEEVPYAVYLNFQADTTTATTHIHLVPTIGTSTHVWDKLTYLTAARLGAA